MQDPSFSYSRPFFGSFCGTLSPSRRQMGIRINRVFLSTVHANEAKRRALECIYCGLSGCFSLRTADFSTAMRIYPVAMRRS